MNQYRNRSTIRVWLAAFALTALAGCDSGGGGGGIDFNALSGSARSGPVGSSCAGAACVSLGTAGNYALLAKSAISTVPSSVVTGHVGVSPAARTFLTGWSLIGEPTDTYFTSAQVVGGGRLYAADNVGGTTSVDLTTAIGDMQTAYTAAAGKPAGAGVTNLNRGAGTLTNDTLVPGTYTWGTPLNIPTDLTLTGSATDVWIFQITGTLTMPTPATRITMAGGALAKNVFWQVSGAVTVAANAHFEGIVLGQTAINFGNLSTINGRLLAQTAVSLNATTVTVPQ